jgi:peptidoglycan/LPS O-acetylase OafA/YrhL
VPIALSPESVGTDQPGRCGPGDPAEGLKRRIVALDGLRGLMTILVVVSHFFAEIPNGLSFLAFGWVAVDMFFVLSGFLVGRLIIEKGHASNFLAVFYVRRVCRTFPIYFVCVLIAVAIFSAMPNAWSDMDAAFPVWSYLAFSQNFFMVASGSIGAHWLAPTWTLAVEEQFYLFAPAVLLLTPRRHLISVLCAIAGAAVLFRAVIYGTGFSAMSALVLFPGRADILACGLLAAILFKIEGIPWKRLDVAIRVAPIPLLASVSAIKLAEGDAGRMFEIVGPLLVSLACGAFILAIARDAPEAARFRSKVLCFFGTTSYAVYLTHLPVLWLMHGLLLGSEPALGNALQWAVTLAAVPSVVLVSWVLTRLVEQPVTTYGRSWGWSEARPSGAPGPAPTVEPA